MPELIEIILINLAVSCDNVNAVVAYTHCRRRASAVCHVRHVTADTHISEMSKFESGQSKEPGVKNRKVV